MALKDFKSNIRRYRKQAHITQKELGEKTGYAEVSIRQMESGLFHPTLAGLERIADAVGVEIDDLLKSENNGISRIYQCRECKRETMQSIADCLGVKLNELI